jgi:hypothetical protein
VRFQKGFVALQQSLSIKPLPERKQMKTIALRNVMPGDFVKRKADSKAVYVKGDYDKSTKAFELIDTEDICRRIYVKADKLVVVGFTY